MSEQRQGRNPRAGHLGAIGRRHRCRLCSHYPGVRTVTATRKTAGKDPELTVPTVHKRPCGCQCHPVVIAQATDAD